MEACKETCDWHKEKGFEAQLLKLDNETSKSMIQAIKTNNQDCQPASPSDHQINPAKQATQAVEAHFISIRACTDPSYPKNQWDLLTSHAEFTLNPLRPSKINKNIIGCASTLLGWGSHPQVGIPNSDPGSLLTWQSVRHPSVVRLPCPPD